MSRNLVVVREAVLGDAPALIEIWGEFSKRPSGEEPLPEAAAAVARIATDADERLLVAVMDDQTVGAAHLMRSPISPLNAEMAVSITHLHVAAAVRRRGVGRALIEAAVSWAEEKDTGHVLVAAPVNSRDANRFLARLGLAQIAVVRAGSVTALRAKLPVEPPAAARVGPRSHRSVGAVLAQRRSQRRALDKSE